MTCLKFDHLEPLKGYATDIEVLRPVFTDLYFKVKVFENQSTRDMKSEISKYSNTTMKNNIRPNAFVCIILTHGYNSETLYGKSHNPQIHGVKDVVNVEDLLEIVDNQNSTLLAQIPKLFFIQACRGDKTDNGVLQRPGPPDTFNYKEDMSQSQDEDETQDWAVAAGAGPSHTEAQTVTLGKIPVRSDVMLCFSAIPGFRSYVDDTGSVFVKKLAYILINNAHAMDIKSLMSMLSAAMKDEEVRLENNLNAKQPISERYDGFAKKLYFNPGYEANNNRENTLEEPAIFNSVTDSNLNENLPNEARRNRDLPNEALTNGALPNVALPNEALANGALPNGDLQNEALPNGALPDGDLQNEARPNGDLPNEALTNGALPNEALPNEALPNEALSNETLPIEALPNEALPNGALPNGALPIEALPIEALPIDVLPNGALPIEALPNGAPPIEALPNGALLIEALPIEALPNGAPPIEALPSGALLIEALPNEALPNGALTNGPLPKEARRKRKQAPRRSRSRAPRNQTPRNRAPRKPAPQNQTTRNRTPGIQAPQKSTRLRQTEVTDFFPKI